MSKRGLIVMTALVPTIGHQYLINFAKNFMAASGDLQDYLDIVICGRRHEPIRVWDRMHALKDATDNRWNTNFMFVENDPPQNPEDHPDFWEIWAGIVEGTTGTRRYDYLFASEMYGLRFAECFGATFIPCDVDREIYPVKGTNVRKSLFSEWNNVLPSMRHQLRRTITTFGCESVGKTTTAMSLHSIFPSRWVHEWARPYLEKIGPEITDEKMEIIVSGQYGAMRGVASNPDTPFVFQDTDLLSTIGYYRIYSGREPEYTYELFQTTKSDLYLMLTSEVAFVPDPLRYGGDKRESTDQFWIDLLEEFDCNYRVISGDKYMDRMHQCDAAVMSVFPSEVSNFMRD